MSERGKDANMDNSKFPDGTKKILETAEDPAPDALDLLLMQRSHANSSLPELAARVQRQVDSRERARLWLKEHPDYFRRKMRQATSPVIRQAPAETRTPQRGLSPGLRSLVIRISASGSPRTWSLAGSIVLGAACGYLLVTQLAPTVRLASFNAFGGLAVAAALGSGLAAAAASQWRSIRSYLA